MSAPALGLAGWVLLAFVFQIIPSTDHHWRRAYLLMALGAPLLVWIAWDGRWGLLLAAVLAMGLVLRWPVYYGALRIRRVLGGGQG